MITSAINTLIGPYIHRSYTLLKAYHVVESIIIEITLRTSCRRCTLACPSWALGGILTYDDSCLENDNTYRNLDSFFAIIMYRSFIFFESEIRSLHYI